MTVKIQLRRGTAAEWTSANPTLLSGEQGLETDTGKTKIGDGVTAWNSLGYAFVQNALISASKGALITSTGSAVDDLTVGANGTRLTADSGETLGIKWAADPVVIGVACSDETTDLTTGTAKATFRMPHAMTLTAVRATVTTAPEGSTIIVDINEGGTSILSTALSIDASEKTSTTAATAAVISDSALADDAEITIDIDQVGSATAGAGLKVWLIGTRA